MASEPISQCGYEDKIRLCVNVLWKSVKSTGNGILYYFCIPLWHALPRVVSCLIYFSWMTKWIGKTNNAIGGNKEHLIESRETDHLAIEIFIWSVMILKLGIYGLFQTYIPNVCFLFCLFKFSFDMILAAKVNSQSWLDLKFVVYKTGFAPGNIVRSAKCILRNLSSLHGNFNPLPSQSPPRNCKVYSLICLPPGT